MESPKISVIVAVYKAEAYLRRCLDSLLAQTFRDFEVLLVDDGSPDKSGEICDEYAAKDARVRVFHKENGGVSSARQCGIDHAKGEYTTHVDPDDWVEPTMLADLYTKAKEEDADMVISDCYIEYQDGTTIYETQEPSSLQPEGVLSDIIYHKLRISLCGRIIRLSCYQDYDVSFLSSLKYGEDNFVLIKLLCKIRKVSYFPCAFYHYDLFSNVNSLTRSNQVDRVEVNEKIVSYYKDDLYNKNPRLYHAHLSVLAYDFFVDNLLTATDFRKKYYHSFSMFLQASVSLKIKFFICLSALGYKDVAYKTYRLLKRSCACFSSLKEWNYLRYQ